MKSDHILSKSVRNRDTEEPGISISIDFGKFPVSVSESESTLTKIWYLTQWFWAFHWNLCYKTCLTLVSVSESESKFWLFLVSVSVSKSTRHRKSLSIRIGIKKAGIAGSCHIPCGVRSPLHGRSQASLKFRLHFFWYPNHNIFLPRRAALTLIALTAPVATLKHWTCPKVHTHNKRRETYVNQVLPSCINETSEPSLHTF